MAAIAGLDAADQARTLAWLRAKFLMIVFSLTGFGLVMVYSASAVRATRGGGWEMSYAWSQLSWFLVALAALVFFSLAPYRLWGRLWWAFIPGCYLLLAAVMTPLGTRVNGANRWFRFGSFNVQPSELAKIGMIVAMSALLARIADGKPRFFRHVIPLAGASLFAVGLIAIEPDFGTAALLGAALTVLMLGGGVKLWQLLLLLAPVLPALGWYGLTHFSHIKERMDDWMGGEAFHTNVSKLAIGSGGIWGMGLGQGPAKLDYLPEAHTDFIFAMVGQETGLIGGLALITLFMVLVWQGLGIAKYAPDRFGSLLAFGITVILGGQALFNLGVVTGLLPPKGISLPFVSFGGSGLVVYYSMVGLMVSVTRGVAAPARLDDLRLKFKPREKFSFAHSG